MIHIFLYSQSPKLAYAARQLIADFSPLPETIHCEDYMEELDDPDDPEENPFGCNNFLNFDFSFNKRWDQILVLVDTEEAFENARYLFWRRYKNIPYHVLAAPFIEGGIAAAKAAGRGASLAEVIEAAENALLPKQSLKTGKKILVPESARLTITLRNSRGLDALLATKLAARMSVFKSEVTLCNMNYRANAKSPHELLHLKAQQWEKLDFFAEGDDALTATQTLQTFAAEHFRRSEDPQTIIARGTVHRLDQITARLKGPSALYNVGYERSEDQMLSDIKFYSTYLDRIAREMKGVLSTEFSEHFEQQAEAWEYFKPLAIAAIQKRRGNVMAAWHQFCQRQRLTLSGRTDEEAKMQLKHLYFIEHDVLLGHFAEGFNANEPFIYVDYRISPAAIWELGGFAEGHCDWTGTDYLRDVRLRERCQAIIVGEKKVPEISVKMLAELNIPFIANTDQYSDLLYLDEKIHLDLRTGKISIDNH